MDKPRVAYSTRLNLFLRRTRGVICIISLGGAITYSLTNVWIASLRSATFFFAAAASSFAVVSSFVCC